MSSEHRSLMHRILTSWNERDVEEFVGCYTDPLVVHDGTSDQVLTLSRQQHAENAQVWWSRFPDMHEVADEILSDEDRVFLRTTSRGTLATPWRGIEPTDDPVSWESWYRYRVEGGLVAEERMVMDLLGLFVQLGAVEMPT